MKIRLIDENACFSKGAAARARLGGVPTRIVPGGPSARRYAHSRLDGFVRVLEGEGVPETGAGAHTLGPGLRAGFAAGTGDGHRVVIRGARDGGLPVVGDRTAGDDIDYPDLDMRGILGSDGRDRFTREDGAPFLTGQARSRRLISARFGRSDASRRRGP